MEHGKASGTVVLYSSKKGKSRRTHEFETHRSLASRIAALKQFEFAGEFEASYHYPGAVYFVPSETLVSIESARQLGIEGEQDLFGGVVPYPFVASKVITHPLLSGSSKAPQGWRPRFAQEVHDVVLPGYSAFSIEDALEAGMLLLQHGAVRIKKASGIAGVGQFVVADREQLHEQLEQISSDQLWNDGLVVELNLRDVETYSVGQVTLDDMVATYYGTQRSTLNNRGMEVYGGSSLVIVRGEFDTLLELEMPDQARTAVAQARKYHAAAFACYPGMFASRCNYDVVQGYDEQGGMRTGVLEQSWRIGGASAAEIAALEAFLAAPDLTAVRASTTEVYGSEPAIPADARVYFSGDDENIGTLTKYSRLEPYANS